MEIKLDNILDNSCSFPIKRDFNGAKVIFINKTLYLELENVDKTEDIYTLVKSDKFIPRYTSFSDATDNEIENNRFWLFKFIYKATPFDSKYFYLRNAFYFIHYRDVMGYIFSKVRLGKNVADELVSIIKENSGMDIVYEWVRNYFDGILSYKNYGPVQYGMNRFQLELILVKDKYVYRPKFDFYMDIDFNNYEEKNKLYCDIRTFFWANMTSTRTNLFRQLNKDYTILENQRFDKLLRENPNIKCTDKFIGRF